jgi:hypothetical protein
VITQATTIKLALAAVAVMTLANVGLYVQREQARAELIKYRAEVAESTQRAEAQARQTETTLRTEAETLRTKMAKEAKDAKTRQDRLVADIRAGTQRMSIAAACPAPLASQAGEDTAAAPGDGADSARAELDHEAAAALIAIAADGDQAIRERNACVAAYNKIRQLMSEE